MLWWLITNVTKEPSIPKKVLLVWKSHFMFSSTVSLLAHWLVIKLLTQNKITCIPGHYISEGEQGRTLHGAEGQ